ncbi:TlpA family protein disulfide reductase [Mucilaginibacter paludis]|uniref:Redoxin domain protein n=1 Tax=Mucilaginibacter paludis DSM 18603 TaxID=714943 RepID=H1YBE4_9SPHI|nr:TlpA disulfide reductase family protein [Mucilaginibacter paludis]EHQ31198.1 Redoxin domain protein [Mucilaginibacter paludis DSM 18603]
MLDESAILNASVLVDITYANNGEIKNEKKLVFVAQSNDPHHSGMDFTFPEFGYCRFVYKGKPYLLATGSNTANPYITVLPDRPYFTSIGWDKRVKKDQVVQIGDDELLVSNITDNTKEITLTGNDIYGFATGLNSKGTSPQTAVKKAPALTLRQTGFIAPPVKGININPNASPGTSIATANLKGKYVFIDFWSTYCGPCIQEFDYLKEAYAKYNRQQLEIVGVIDDRDQNVTLQILKEHNINWPNIKMEASGTSIPGYQDINSYPTNLLIDPQGKIIAMDLRGDALMNKLKTLIAL